MRHRPTFRSQTAGRLMVLGVAVVMTAAAVAAQRGTFEPLLAWWHRASPERATILFVVLDTVRADHLSLCGYARPTSPTLDHLARTGAAWTCSAYAPGSWTLPSHASFFTGLDVPAHGADFVVEGDVIRGMSIRPLDSEFLTLAERFRERGYQTAGVSGNPVLVHSSGLSQGFEHWQVAPTFGVWYGDALVARLRRMLRRLDGTSPLFLFINIADAHDPWPGVPEGLGWVPPRSDGVHYFASSDPGLWEAYVSDSMDETQAVAFRERITDLYDYGVYRADRTLDAVLRAVREYGWDSAGLRLVVTADHGEFLGEHGLARHGRYLWEPNNRVPLLVIGPEPVALDAPVSAMEVFDLLFEGARPDEPLLPAATAVPDTLWLKRSGGRVGGSTSAALWTPDAKLLWRDGEFLRYDLAADPAERHPAPLPDEAPGRAHLAALVERLRQQIDREAGEAPGELLERLKALGYIR